MIHHAFAFIVVFTASYLGLVYLGVMFFVPRLERARQATVVVSSDAPDDLDDERYAACGFSAASPLEDA